MRAEQLAERVFGYVVLGRSETSRNDYDVAYVESAAYCRAYIRGVVAYRRLLDDGYACRVEVAGYRYGVGVDDLSYQDLVAYGYDCGFH